MKMLLLCALTLSAQVPYSRILNTELDQGNWLTYSGNLQGHRFSPLHQINQRTVSALKPVWVYQIDRRDKFETVPLIADGIMYISEPPSDVTALDARTGRVLWSFRRGIPDNIPICCGTVNRGVALLDDKVFVGTVDAHLIALDAKTGNIVWDTVVENWKTGHSITVAPLAYKDKIAVGIAGGEFGIRGFLDAYEAKTGKRAWRTYTVPVAGELGVDTWEGESFKNGAATTWTTGSYDPGSNTIFWGTGNPGPDWNDDHRKGDNLFSDSVLALDGDTGKMKWYFQFTPHDTHDWDTTQVPVLVDRKGQKQLLLANRNAFFYVLDRTTGEFIRGKAFAKQTWAKGLDAKGRPMLVEGMTPTKQGVLVYPSVPGATNYYSPAYSPLTDLFYVNARDEGAMYYTEDKPWQVGKWWLGGRWIFTPNEERHGAVRALDPETAGIKWEFPLHTAPWAGILATAGGLVFAGTDEGHFLALDHESGKLLWRFPAGGRILSSPVTFLADGKQHIAIAAGHDIFVFGLE